MRDRIVTGVRPLLTTLALAAVGCHAVPVRDASTADAIRRVLIADTKLASVRNEAPRDGSLAEASAAYAEALRGLDYSHTPPAFERAFLGHADAWRSFAEELSRRPHLDTFRDEMHQAIEKMKAAHPEAADDVQRQLDRIWATWDDVVLVSADYRIDANAPAQVDGSPSPE